MLLQDNKLSFSRKIYKVRHCDNIYIYIYKFVINNEKQKVTLKNIFKRKRKAGEVHIVASRQGSHRTSLTYKKNYYYI